MPYNTPLVTWKLIPVDLPPPKHRWKTFLKKLYENGGNLQEPSGGSSQSTEGSPTPERILKKNIMPNGAENITVLVYNKGNISRVPERKEKSTRKVRRVSNEVQSSSSVDTISSRPSHSLDNLPSSYQRSNLTERHDRDRATCYDRLSSYDRVSSHDGSNHSRNRKSWPDERSSRTEKSWHPETSKPLHRAWFQSHDMRPDSRSDDYGHDRHRPPEELQYRSSYATNIRISLDPSSPRKVYDVVPSRHRRHSDEAKRSKHPYARPHDMRTPAQERLIKLDKQLKEERERKLTETTDREASGSDAEATRKKNPPVEKQPEKVVNGDGSELDDEALCVWEVKADEVDIRRNGGKNDDAVYSPHTVDSRSPVYDRSCSRYDKKPDDRPNSIQSPSSSESKTSKPLVESNSSNTVQKESSKSCSYQRNLYKRKNQSSEDDQTPTEKLRNLADSLPNKRPRSVSPEMMDWAPTSSDVIHSEVEELRKNGLVDYSLDFRNNYPSSSLCSNNHSSEENIIFIVVDTNIMCTDLVQKLKNKSLAGIDLVVYVPWQVLVELDALKSSKREIAKEAQRACSLLSDRTNHSSGWLRYQHPAKHRTSVDDFVPQSPDDYILLSALQLTSDSHSAILLSNDKNLIAKAEAAGVKQFTEIGFNKVVNPKRPKSALIDFEKRPTSSVPAECLMAHHLAGSFKSLLVSCLERLKSKLVRGNLWVLYVAVLPPWSLLDSIKAARSSWDILCPDSSRHYDQLRLLNSIENFLVNTTYDKMSVGKCNNLFEECCALATSLPSHFSQYANIFLSQAKKILDEELDNSTSLLTTKLNDSYELEDLSPEERASNIIDQFDVLSRKLQSFCFCVYSLRGINWPMGRPNPSEEKNLSSEFISRYTPFAVSTLETIISSLTRLSDMEIGQVDNKTDSVVAVHKCLSDFNEDLYKYSATDVAAFANNSKVRENMDSGIVELKKLMEILNKIV